MKETGVRGRWGTYRSIQDGWAWISESEIIIFLYAYADQYNHDKQNLPVVFLHVDTTLYPKSICKCRQMAGYPRSKNPTPH